MILGDKTYLRNFEISVQTDILNQTRLENQNEYNKKVKRKKGKNSDNNICRDLKNKVNITSKNQKKIKENLELVKSQEQKVHNIEKNLKGVKSIYEEAIKEEKYKKVKANVKTKQFLKEIKGLAKNYNVDENHLIDDENMIFSIDEALKSIHNIKNKLSECKFKLINMEKYINRSKNDFESKEKLVKRNVNYNDCINEKILINPLEFIFIEGDLKMGGVINVFI